MSQSEEWTHSFPTFFGGRLPSWAPAASGGDGAAVLQAGAARADRAERCSHRQCCDRMLCAELPGHIAEAWASPLQLPSPSAQIDSSATSDSHKSRCCPYPRRACSLQGAGKVGVQVQAAAAAANRLQPGTADTAATGSPWARRNCTAIRLEGARLAGPLACMSGWNAHPCCRWCTGTAQ